jgi:transcriptional regulator with XRE-family HTH domain
MASPRGKKEETRAEALGALVRKLRRGRGENLEKLAKRIPMSPSNLSRLELGKQGPPADEVIESLATALEVDADELLRAAGRVAGSKSFEDAVMERLDDLGREVQEVRKAVLGDRPKS